MSTAGRRVRRYAGVVEGGALNPLVIVMRDANENADITTFLKIEHQSGVLNCFPGSLEKQPMLRIHIRRFPGRNAEKLRVKLVDLVEETAPLRKSFSGNTGFGIVIPLHIPPISGHIGDGIPPFSQ